MKKWNDENINPNINNIQQTMVVDNNQNNICDMWSDWYQKKNNRCVCVYLFNMWCIYEFCFHKQIYGKLYVTHTHTCQSLTIPIQQMSEMQMGNIFFFYYYKRCLVVYFLFLSYFFLFIESRKNDDDEYYKSKIQVKSST